MFSGNESQEGKNGKPFNFKLYITAGCACFGSLSMGYVLGYSSPAIPKLEEKFSGTDFTSKHRSLFASLMTIAALIGGLIAGKMTEKLGRKMVLIITAVPFIFGWILITASKSVIQLLIGRFITGVCCGLVSLTVPVYIAEITPPNLRGFLGTWIQICITIGILTAFALGLVLSWSMLALFGIFFPVLLCVTMFLLPETPHWLLAHKRRDEAIETLKLSYGPSVNVEEECKNIQDNIDAMSETNVRLIELFQHPNFKALLVSLGLMMFQQISGINVVMFYTVTIFKESGSSVDPNLATVIVGAIQVPATMVACVLMDKAGRKVLLTISGLAMGTSLFFLGLYNKMEGKIRDDFGWLPLFSLMSFIIAFALGYGPIPWLMMAELLPTRVRGISSGIATAVNWLLAFAVTATFDVIVSQLKTYGTYWLYSGFCAASVFFVYFVPETKGKTLEEIEAYFRG